MRATAAVSSKCKRRSPFTFSHRRDALHPSPDFSKASDQAIGRFSGRSGDRRRCRCFYLSFILGGSTFRDARAFSGDGISVRVPGVQASFGGAVPAPFFCGAPVAGAAEAALPLLLILPARAVREPPAAGVPSPEFLRRGGFWLRGLSTITVAVVVHTLLVSAT